MIAHVLIGLATIFMFEIFQSLRDLDIAQATLVHYVNISEPLPQIPNDTLTSSMRRRMNELYGSQQVLLDASIVDTTADITPEVLKFYKDYMTLYMNKFSQIQLFTNRDSSLKLFTLNSRWIKAKPYTDFSLHTLKEEKLYQVNPKESKGSQRRVWKHGFYQRMNGSVEATAGNPEQDIIIVALHNTQNDTRSFMYFDKLKYDYSNSMNTALFSDLYYIAERRTGGIDSNIDYKSYYSQDVSSVEENSEKVNNLPEFNIYEVIPIDEDQKIEHIAVTEDLIVYITAEDRMKLKYMYKNNQTWITKSLEYPISSVRFRLHKNIGMSFIFDAATGDKQLLLIDLVASESEVQLIYHLYQFVQGDSLMNDEMLRYSYGVQSRERVETGKIYGTKSSAGKISLPQELATIDILRSFPRSMIKSNPATKQVLIACLNKYVFLGSKESQKEGINISPIKHFEDMESRIKDIAISEDGAYYSVLMYNKDREKVLIVPSKAAHTLPENKLYLVNFDHPIGLHDNTIKETRIVNSQNNEPVLMLLMEAGEVATFSLEFGVMTWHGLSGLLSGDDLDFFSLFSVLFVILMFIIAKVASSTRIRINLQRPR